MTLLTDCASLWDHIYLKKQVSEKRLLVKLSPIRDYAVQNVEWIETSRQLADELTKRKSPVLLMRCLKNSTLPYSLIVGTVYKVSILLHDFLLATGKDSLFLF